MNKIFFCALIAGVIAMGISACEKKKEKMIVLGQNGTTLEKPKEEVKVRIAVGGMITPKEGGVYYRDLLRYVQDRIGEKIEYVDRESYAEINEMLKTGKLDLIFDRSLLLCARK
jgi:phosphonate transport system substrate-binding protein